MSLARRSILSSSYTILSSGVQTVILIFRSILLARLLSPEVFGAYSFAASFVLVSRPIPNFGMSAALVHRASESEGELPLRVHFTLSLSFNIIWVVLISLIGSFFIQTSDRWVLVLLAATQFIDNISQTGNAILIRNVTFQRIAIIDLLTVIFATVASLWLAVAGAGIWSLVITDIVAAVLLFGGLHLFRPVWRIRFGWSTNIARYLIGFGRPNLFASLLSQALDKFDDIWSGYFLGKTALGYYSRAYAFATYPRKILANPVSSVASGTYAELKNQPKRLSQAFFRVNALLLRSGFLLAGLLALVAPEFIRLVLGVKWLPMLTAFRLMLIYTMLDPLKLTISNLFVAVGKPEITLRARTIQLVVLISCLFLFGFRFGIAGVAAAVDLMLIIGIIILLHQSKKFVQYSIRRLFAIPTFALFAGMVLARGALLIPGVLGSPWRTGIVKTFVFMVIYFGILILLERNEIGLMVKILKRSRTADDSDSFSSIEH